MKIVKNMIVAFSLYSQIPMPQFEWEEEDMKHNLVFLPWIGAVIGALSMGIYYLLQLIEVPLICKVALFALIPLIVTGGFHMDGYMDVQDALKSYKSPKEKLEILKDPHIGAFSIIRLLILGLIWGAAFSVLINNGSVSCMKLYFCIFFIARAGAAFTSLKFEHARQNGMLHMETEKSTNIDGVIIAFELIAGLALMCVINVFCGIMSTIVMLVYSLYYRYLCYKQFGGVTGDTAGFYVVTLEQCFLVAIAIMSYWV